MNYVIGHIGETPGGRLVYELVLPDLQRAHVTIPRKHATADNIDQIIQHTLDGIYRPTKAL